MHTINEETIEKIVGAIVRECDPEAIYLFGSRARGDAGEMSDLDLMIITREPFSATNSRRQLLARLWRLVAEFRVPVDIVVYSRQEMDEMSLQPGHLIERALNEGRPLYAAA